MTTATKDGVKLPKQQIPDLTKEGIKVKLSKGTMYQYSVTTDEAELITLDASTWLAAVQYGEFCTNCRHSVEHARAVVRVTAHKLSQYVGCEYDVCSLDFEPVDEEEHIKKLLKQSGVNQKTEKKTRWSKLEVDNP